MTDPTCVYGLPPLALAAPPAEAIQTSPLIPGSTSLEEMAPESLSAAVVLAPPGTLERRYVMALALRALKPGGALTALAPKDKGGSRLRGELETFGCTVEEAGKSHHRISHVTRPLRVDGDRHNPRLQRPAARRRHGPVEPTGRVQLG